MSTATEVINVRIPAAQKALIDSAAQLLGKSRTAFWIWPYDMPRTFWRKRRISSFRRNNGMPSRKHWTLLCGLILLLPSC